MKPGCGTQKNSMVLVARIHARDHADTKNSRAAGQRWHNFGKGGRRKTIADHLHGTLGQASLNQTLRRRAGIAHYDVAPAEHACLGTEMCWAKQIAKLALTADHYWRPRQSRGWNQRQVRIEVEGLRNRNVIPAQVLSQPETRSQGLQARQAPAQAKLRQLA
jgi:hypothetical protein